MATTTKPFKKVQTLIILFWDFLVFGSYAQFLSIKKSLTGMDFPAMYIKLNFFYSQLHNIKFYLSSTLKSMQKRFDM